MIGDLIAALPRRAVGEVVVSKGMDGMASANM